MPNSTVRGIVQAVERLGRLGLAREVDGLGGGALHPEGQLVGGDPRRQLGVGRVEVLLVHRSQQVEHPALAGERDARRRLEVDDRHRAAAEQRPLVMSRQEPGPPARGASFGRPLGLGHHDVGRQVLALRPEAVGDPAPQAGKAHEDPARVHLIHGRGMDHAVGVARADQRDVVGVRVQVRHEVRHVHPRLAILAPLAVAAQAERVALEELAVNLAEAGRQRLRVEPVQERLGVEQVHLARAAGHEQENAALGLGREMARPGSQRAGRRAGRASREPAGPPGRAARTRSRRP